ncbi:MAG: leucine-rich repeat protein [Lachnospiraceae bacterium]|nr:leucine-rich repeat protein [Lachnospiraceae bacterium]
MANKTVNTSTKTGNSSASGKSKVGKRRLKKQVRRTLGGLFLASAIAVAAIPVEPTSAMKTKADTEVVIDHADDTTTNLVRAVHYTDKNNNTYEKINGEEASSTWRSEVPYVGADEQIYVDESKTYQFAFVKENSSSTDYYAVILGAKSSAISSDGSLTIPDTVDAYYAYASNTTTGRYSYCAVNKSGDYLYYKTSAQMTNSQGQKKYHFSYYEAVADSSTNYPNAPTDANNSFGGLAKTLTNVSDLYADESAMVGTTSTASYPLAYDPESGVLSYVQTYHVWNSTGISINTDSGTGTSTTTNTYNGSWEEKTAYYPLSGDYEDTFVPCYLDNKDTWSPDDVDVELFYWSGTGTVNLKDTSSFTSIKNSTDASVQRVYQCAVRYIGMQSVVANVDSEGNDTGTWTVTAPTTVTASDGTITTTESNGVFYNNGNLRNLTIGGNLAGIGDYAFYRCTALSSVTFSNQLNTIGNGAFMGCNNLTAVNLDPWTDLSIIGASAFEGCAGLTKFDVPIHVSAIGDRAFKDCTGLNNIYMCGENSGNTAANMTLEVIGFNAFVNDSALTYLEFPKGLSQKLPVHDLAGCTGLKYIKSNNATFDIVDGDPDIDSDYSSGYTAATETASFHHGGTSGGSIIEKCDIDIWLDSLNDENFYFESNDQYDLHKTAKDHSAAFLYDDTEYAGDYEIVVVCDEIPSHENTFIVDTSNNLVNATIDPDCHVLTIPNSIGGYGVSNIAEGSFSNNCSMEKLYIPSSVNSIAAGAFTGCHNLNTVFFTEPYNYNLTIGEGAFDTQAGVTTHQSGCAGLASTPSLSFVGEIDGNYAPFAYAMNGANNINVGTQPTTYITYYSGWPEFLEIQYNPDRADGEKIELQSYPTRSYLSDMNTLCKAYETKYAAYETVLNDTTSSDAAIEAAAQEVSDAQEAIDDKYPFLSSDNYADIVAIFNVVGTTGTDGETITWADVAEGKVSGMTEDQVTCANSIYDLNVPYGVQSLKEGVLSNLDNEGNIVDSSLVNTGSTPGVNKLGANSDLKSVELSSVVNVEPYALAGLKSLESFDMTGGTTIGDYAFFGDDVLENVSVSDSVTSLGRRPFRDCTSLLDVNFAGTNFTCTDGVIYGSTDATGDTVVECLETRGQNFDGTFNGSTTVSGDELSGVKYIQEEAFMNCDHIETVELDSSSIQNVPERTFAATDDLYLVTFPDSLKTIKKDAFLDSNIRQVSIPYTNTQIQDEYVFGQTENGWPSSASNYDEFLSGYQSTGTDNIVDATDEEAKPETNPYVSNSAVTRNITFYTPEDSAATIYADDHTYINASATTITYKVYFWDPKADDPSTAYDIQDVASGSFASDPVKEPSHDGYTFSGWSLNGTVVDVPSTEITGTTNFTALYDGDTVTVTFYVEAFDADGNYTGMEVWDEQTVQYGGNASTPTAPTRDGYEFLGWDKEYSNVTEDLSVNARFEKIDSSDKHHVVFYNYDDTIVSEQYVADGESATTPSSPTRSGYTFSGWKPSDFTNVTSDMSIYAIYEKNSSSGGGSSSGGSSSGGSSSSSGNSSSKTSSGNSSTAKTYTVTVVNGSGSGTYAEGTTVVIAANDPASGKAFDKWTTADATLASTTLSATTFKMPGKNVTVTANYKAGSSSSTVKYATGNSSRPVATGSTATGSTQVQVNKGGVSNVDIASAKVRGSTDSFIVKVTETNEATNQVENALNNRFGSLDSLRYWPCDISLYDSTGNTKITDTTGLSIEITLPIPDTLRQYGGNNKVAAVSNNQLEELDTRFNTVNGTPTVTFTATHFSPYVIYADTNNLNASQMLDSSPKTGDPIHPKWFLAIGLFAGSIFMFLKRDKKTIAAAA